jgi:hypothetical protein
LLGEEAAAKRIVTVEQDIVDWGMVERGEGDVLIDEACVHVVTEVDRRRLLRFVMRATEYRVVGHTVIVPYLVGTLHEVWNPTDAAFREDDIECGEPETEPRGQSAAAIIEFTPWSATCTEPGVSFDVDTSRELDPMCVYRGTSAACAAAKSGSQKAVWIDGSPSTVAFSEKAMPRAPSATARSNSATTLGISCRGRIVAPKSRWGPPPHHSSRR